MTRRRVWRLLAALALVPAWPWIWLADWCLYRGREQPQRAVAPSRVEASPTMTLTDAQVRAALDDWARREQWPRQYH